MGAQKVNKEIGFRIFCVFLNYFLTFFQPNLVSQYFVQNIFF